jgi:hypothetical protein
VAANPNKKEAILGHAVRGLEKLLRFLLGGLIPPSKFRENNRICKEKMNEIRLKHRSEEIRNRNSFIELFRKYSNVSVV